MTCLYRNRGKMEVKLQLIRNPALERGGWPAQGSQLFTLEERPCNRRLGGPRGRSVLTFLKYVRCFQEAVHQDPWHWYNKYTKKCLHLNHLALLHYDSCVQKWLIWFHTVLFWFDSLTIVHCRPKHGGTFSVIMCHNEYVCAFCWFSVVN